MGILPLSNCKLFQIHGSKFKPHPIGYLGQAGVGNLYAYKLSHKKACSQVVICDECQHLRYDDASMTQRILREGRKHGFGMWTSSQWIDKPAAVKALGQAALQIFFRPDEGSIEQTAKRLTPGSPQYRNACIRELLRLQPGEFYCLSQGVPIKVDTNIPQVEIKVDSPFIPSSPRTKRK